MREEINCCWKNCSEGNNFLNVGPTLGKNIMNNFLGDHLGKALGSVTLFLNLFYFNLNNKIHKNNPLGSTLFNFS